VGNVTGGWALSAAEPTACQDRFARRHGRKVGRRAIFASHLHWDAAPLASGGLYIRDARNRR
jgi:hypothetical protein